MVVEKHGTYLQCFYYGSWISCFWSSRLVLAVDQCAIREAVCSHQLTLATERQWAISIAQIFHGIAT